jgi:hypothetical protein
MHYTPLLMHIAQTKTATNGGKAMQHPPKNIVVDWINTIWETSLGPNTKLIACCLRRYMNSKNDSAYPSVPRIAGECGLSENTVRKHLAILCEEGWLVKNGKSHLDTFRYTAAYPPSIIAPPSTVAPLQPLRQTPSTIEGKLNNELNNTSLSTAKRFRKPTREELVDYQGEAGLVFCPDGFLDYWESVGWKRGRSPMKDWKATARQWAKNERNRNANTRQAAGNTGNTRRLSPHERVTARAEARRAEAAGQTITTLDGYGWVME